MVRSCSVRGCKARFKKNTGLGFFSFPKQSRNPLKRRAWIDALAENKSNGCLLSSPRQQWAPKTWDYVCGRHFVSGQTSDDPNDLDYAPSLYLTPPSPASKAQKNKRRNQVKKPEKCPSSTLSEPLTSSPSPKSISSNAIKQTSDNDVDTDTCKKVNEGEIAPKASVDGRKRWSALIKYQEENPYKKTYQLSKYRKRKSEIEHEDEPYQNKHIKLEINRNDKHSHKKTDKTQSREIRECKPSHKQHKATGNPSYDKDILTKMPSSLNPAVKIYRLPKECVELLQTTPPKSTPMESSPKQKQKIMKPQKPASGAQSSSFPTMKINQSNDARKPITCSKPGSNKAVKTNSSSSVVEETVKEKNIDTKLQDGEYISLKAAVHSKQILKIVDSLLACEGVSRLFLAKLLTQCEDRYAEWENVRKQLIPEDAELPPPLKEFVDLAMKKQPYENWNELVGYILQIPHFMLNVCLGAMLKSRSKCSLHNTKDLLIRLALVGFLMYGGGTLHVNQQHAQHTEPSDSPYQHHTQKHTEPSLERDWNLASNTDTANESMDDGDDDNDDYYPENVKGNETISESTPIAMKSEPMDCEEVMELADKPTTCEHTKEQGCLISSVKNSTADVPQKPLLTNPSNPSVSQVKSGTTSHCNSLLKPEIQAVLNKQKEKPLNVNLGLDNVAELERSVIPKEKTISSVKISTAGVPQKILLTIPSKSSVSPAKSGATSHHDALQKPEVQAVPIKQKEKTLNVKLSLDNVAKLEKSAIPTVLNEPKETSSVKLGLDNVAELERSATPKGKTTTKVMMNFTASTIKKAIRCLKTVKTTGSMTCPFCRFTVGSGIYCAPETYISKHGYVNAPVYHHILQVHCEKDTGKVYEETLKIIKARKMWIDNPCAPQTDQVSIFTCPLCLHLDTTRHEHYNHVRAHPGQDQHLMCFLCATGYDSYVDLFAHYKEKHEVVCEGNPPPMCSFSWSKQPPVAGDCNNKPAKAVVTKSYKRLCNEMKMKHPGVLGSIPSWRDEPRNSTPIQCEKCGKMLKNYHCARNHRLYTNCTNDPNYVRQPRRPISEPRQCEKCGKLFKNQHSARSHQLYVNCTNDPNFVPQPRPVIGKLPCEKCGKMLNKGNLRYHKSLVNCTNDPDFVVSELDKFRPHKCKKCGVQYHSIWGLRKHNAEVNCDKSEDFKPKPLWVKKNVAAMCTKCGKVLANNSLLQRHNAEVNCTNDPNFVPVKLYRRPTCENCGKIFISKSLLRDHMGNCTEDFTAVSHGVRQDALEYNKRACTDTTGTMNTVAYTESTSTVKRQQDVDSVYHDTVRGEKTVQHEEIVNTVDTSGRSAMAGVDVGHNVILVNISHQGTDNEEVVTTTPQDGASGDMVVYLQ